jgi:hypothetical protein
MNPSNKEVRILRSFMYTCAGLALATVMALAADSKTPVSDSELASWVDARVKERQPSPDERKFDQIGWVKDIREALRLGKENNRPIFLFTHDGRMNVGRC